MNDSKPSLKELASATKLVRRLRLLANFVWLPLAFSLLFSFVGLVFPAVQNAMHSKPSWWATAAFLLIFLPSLFVQAAFRYGSIRCPLCGKAFASFFSMFIFSQCRHCMYSVTNPHTGA